MAIQGDIAEVQAGQLAEKDGASAGVREFGQTLAKDHTKAKAQAVAVAKELKIEPPTKPTAEAQAEHEKLAAMSGAAFDKAFVEAMIDGHKKTIDAFEKEAQARDGKASALAKEQLPVLKKHLGIAQSLQKKEKSASAQ
jgi:putative membrane protein